MSAEPRMQFSGLWPTLLVSRRLPAFEDPTRGLAAYIEGLEAREADLTARFREQSFFASAHSAVRWLKRQIEQTADAFVEQVGIRQKVPWTLMGWCNTNRYGDHHAPHTHPGAYLSGTYYVRVPGGAISFFDPRTGANMVTTGAESDARPAHTVQPGAGTLLMWPSPLQHQVHPNLAEAPRVSISFNLKPARRN